MKSTFLLLLVSLLCSFHVAAQSHFITAGQTQGMIFTDVAPDYVFPNTVGYIYDYTFDLNNNGADDCRIRYKPFYDFTDGFTSIQMYIGSVKEINYDSTMVVSKKFMLGDTMPTFTFSLVSNSNISYQRCEHILPHGICGQLKTYTDPSFPANDHDYYYSIQMLSEADTLLGYIHMTYTSILDFAIESHSALSSTKDLTADKYITTYPNPFTNQININYSKPFNYQITDYIGRVVLVGKAEKTINTEQLPAGNYLLVIKNEETYSVKKIVKVND